MLNTIENIFEDIFVNKKLLFHKLLEYGFVLVEDRYLYETEIMKQEFKLKIAFDEEGLVDTWITEKDTDEDYILYKTNAQGAFVGDIRMAIAEVLEDIAEKCYEPVVFKQEQTLQVIDYVTSAYGDELEFLWKKYDDNAIWRRKDTGKWYGAILTVAANKLGLESTELVEIIDLRLPAEQMEELLKRDGFYPGWHMNKKSWYTVILDGTIANEELFRRIRESYNLARK